MRKTGVQRGFVKWDRGAKLNIRHSKPVQCQLNKNF